MTCSPASTSPDKHNVFSDFLLRNRVWLASILLLLILALINRAQAGASIVFVIEALLETAPYLLLSIAVAAWATASGADNLIARAFSGSPVAMIVFAAVLGGISPFCSCGVIPLIAALLAMRVPLAAVMAFWLASPVIDPSMFVLTAGLLGLQFAVAKTIAAISLGLFGGFITLSLTNMGYMEEPLKSGASGGGCGSRSAQSSGPVEWKFWEDAARRKKFIDEGISTLMFLLKWLTLAFLLESMMLAYVPAEWTASMLGGEGILPILTATIVGVPSYLNGYAALPLVSGLVEQGMSPGAGLAFLVAGGVTSLPAAIAVFALVKQRIFALYVSLALVGSLASGMAFQAVQG